MYQYGAAPSETAMMALAQVRKVYGIRNLAVNESNKTVRVEYDATRLTEPVIHQLLRRAGLDIVETMPMFAPPLPEPEPAAAA